MHGARLHKTSWQDAMAWDLRWDLLGRDWDILLRDQNETRDATVQDWDETETLRFLSEMRRDVSTSQDRLETETKSLLDRQKHPHMVSDYTSVPSTQNFNTWRQWCHTSISIVTVLLDDLCSHHRHARYNTVTYRQNKMYEADTKKSCQNNHVKFTEVELTQQMLI